MTTPARWLGIDVSKHQLDLVSLPDRTHWQAPNTEAGWAQLCTELQQAPPTLIVLEASGRYELGVVMALDAIALTPVVLNPLTARRFAQGLGQRAKNDRLDAEVLARYAEQVRPTPRPIPNEIARQIRELLARRQQLTEHLVMEKNRLAQATSLVRPSITALLAMLKHELTDIDRLLAAVVASDPGWQARVDQLDTVPGIAPLSATRLAVLLPELGHLTARELASLVGIAPYDQESGRHRGTRRIQDGRAPVRRTLYQVLVTTVAHEPTFHAHYVQLLARGKARKVALVACMRRLLGILNAMVRDGLTWQQTQVGQGCFLPVAA
jgi:transposase